MVSLSVEIEFVPRDGKRRHAQPYVAHFTQYRLAARHDRGSGREYIVNDKHMATAQRFGAAPSGEVAYFGGQSGNGGTAPVTVEFSPIAPQDHNIGSVAQSSAFSVSGVSVLPERYGVTSFVGEVTTEKDDGTDAGSQVAISLVLRDDSGAIIYGCITFVSRPAVGESTSFEISPYGIPEYATYEVHAQAW